VQQAKHGMRCSTCGEKMNHHADKLVEPRGDEEELTDPTFGGHVEEVFACPRCGRVESRRLP
jgi:predicted RNA-binding Zn-ribbon protein involved in translation (DUF1610 family)